MEPAGNWQVSAACCNVGMVVPLRTMVAQLIRDARTMLDISQHDLAVAVGVTRAYIGRIEAGRANPTVDLIDRLAQSLGIGVRLMGDLPVVESERQSDAVHAWCSGYVSRRLRRLGWEVRREVLVGSGNRRGWIDIVAFHPHTRTLLLIEIKTWLDDLGAVERQIGRYEQSWRAVAEAFGWRPALWSPWLLVTQTAQADEFIRRNRSTLRDAFPLRASAMRQILSGTAAQVPASARGLAMIDPSSRRREWLIATSADGRRSAPAFRDYADAARRARLG